MFLTVSRDLSTDKQFKGIERLSNSTLSDKSAKRKNSNHNFSNYALRKKIDLLSISWPSDRYLWKWMHWTSVVWHREAKITNKRDFSWVTWELGLANVFWMPLLKYKLMTSQLWIMVIENCNKNFRSTSSHRNGRNPFNHTHSDITNDFQKIVFWGPNFIIV